MKTFSVGITGRLAFSFAAVAILAAAANLIVEHGVAVIQTTQHDAPIVVALPAPAMPVLASPVEAQAPAPVPIQHEITLPAVDPDPLTRAADRYQRAIELRRSVDNPATAEEVRDAAANLDAAAKALKSTMDAWNLGGSAVVARVKATQAAGVEDVHNADARHEAVAQYEARTAAIDARLTASIDGAMKLFGRVLARQSLIQLHNQLGDLRHRFSALTTADGADRPAASQAVASAEKEFSSTLEHNASGFLRSEGEPWVHQLRDDLAVLVELRGSVEALQDQVQDSESKLTAARTHLIEALPKHLAGVVRIKSTPARAPHTLDGQSRKTPDTSQPSTATPAPGQTAPDAPGQVASLVAASDVANPPAVDIVTTTTTSANSHDRRWVAWVTAAVLAVLLAVSVWTVRSILVPVSRLLKATDRISSGDVDVRVPEGGIKELETLGASFNRMAIQLAAARDMTRDYQQRLEEKVEQRTRQLQHLAEHDPLTHLPNRRQLFVLLNHAIDRAEQSHRHVAVFFMDIDNFKNLNDSMGHAFGDEVLTGIAQRLKETAQSFGFAGRLGGDEFTVVYEDADSEGVLLEAGERLIEIFERPFTIDGRDIVVRASVGASLYPNHGRRAEDLLSAADAALFEAKALGRGQLAMFTPELLANATHKFTIEQGLRRAIEKNEFELVFQPEVSMDTLEMVLVESLVRWRLPDGRQAPPSEFLPVTEESGLIVEVGNWVLRKAIETAAQWHHGEWPEARVAVNVSPRQLLDPGFVGYVQDLLAEFKLPPRCIELELTESVLQSGPATIDSLRRLRSFDINIALDDFGTGYSSLSSLENLPLTRIKLDRSLIASIDSNPRSAAIATALIGLCKGLELDITAEGIERPEQFAALAGHRSITLQGYLLSKPITADMIMMARRMIPRVMQDLILTLPALAAPPIAEQFERQRSMA